MNKLMGAVVGLGLLVSSCQQEKGKTSGDIGESRTKLETKTNIDCYTTVIGDFEDYNNILRTVVSGYEKKYGRVIKDTLFLRAISKKDAQEVPGTTDGTLAFVSPESNSTITLINPDLNNMEDIVKHEVIHTLAKGPVYRPKHKHINLDQGEKLIGTHGLKIIAQLLNGKEVRFTYIEETVAEALVYESFDESYNSPARSYQLGAKFRIGCINRGWITPKELVEFLHNSDIEALMGKLGLDFDDPNHILLLMDFFEKVKLNAHVVDEFPTANHDNFLFEIREKDVKQNIEN